MSFLEISLVLSALLCALVAGFVFAFASVVMPGIQMLNDRDFLRAFKAIDLVIQRNQPLFMLVWVGSVFALVIAALLSFWHLAGVDHLLLLLASVIYLLGVQLPTATINIPLNNQLQKLDLDAVNDSAISDARVRFEERWVKWNRIRTVLAALASALLIVLALRL
jgi:uncharacterized membrane protein